MSKRSLGVSIIALMIGGVVFAQPAEKGGGGGGGGGNIEVQLSTKAQDKNSKSKDDAPMILATIIGGPNVPPEKFSIYEPGSKVPFAIQATKLENYNQGTDTIAIALVINGQEIWIGNDDMVPEESPDRYLGVLKGLKTALQAVPFATAGPPGSKGTLITYGDTAEVKVPMGPLANLTGEALGTQKDYFHKTGTAMVQGIERGLAELHGAQSARKALIVVCDGNDTNNEAAKGQLTALKAQAKKDHIETFAIIYKGQLSDPANVISSMIPAPKTVNSADDIATSIKSILERMADRYYLTFPGFDKKTGLGFNWDGKQHELVVKIDKEDAGEAVPVTLAPIWSAPKPMSLWWLWIVIPLVALILIAVAVKVFAKKAEPMPMPMPVMAAPVPEAPKPMGPAKTVMIGVGGDQDGFPVVGWLVPLNGSNAYQTFRLRSGGTKIGTQAPCDVIVNDGFMSTDHCMIQVSPSGFTLVDGGSTNGSYVNDKKVSKHDLVDNDTITLGKTNFKFKSIN